EGTDWRDGAQRKTGGGAAFDHGIAGAGTAARGTPGGTLARPVVLRVVVYNDLDYLPAGRTGLRCSWTINSTGFKSSFRWARKKATSFTTKSAKSCPAISPEAPISTMYSQGWT